MTSVMPVLPVRIFRELIRKQNCFYFSLANAFRHIDLDLLNIYE